MASLYGLVCLGFGARLFGLRFLQRDLALGVGLLLLRLALTLEFFVAREGAGGFFHLALDAFDDALWV